MPWCWIAQECSPLEMNTPDLPVRTEAQAKHNPGSFPWGTANEADCGILCGLPIIQELIRKVSLAFLKVLNHTGHQVMHRTMFAPKKTM